MRQNVTIDRDYSMVPQGDNATTNRMVSFLMKVSSEVAFKSA